MNAEQIIATALLVSCIPFGIWTYRFDRKWGLKK